MTEIDYKGSCFCGKIEFQLEGKPISNVFCHCPGCSLGVGVSPVHCVLVPDTNFRFIKGEEYVNIFDGSGPLRFGKCSECGANIFQYPEGAGFKACYPRMLHGYRNGTNNKLPEDLMPTAHVNYENRQMDYYDNLPKFDKFPPSPSDETTDDDTEPESLDEYETKEPSTSGSVISVSRKHWWDK